MLALLCFVDQYFCMVKKDPIVMLKKIVILEIGKKNTTFFFSSNILQENVSVLLQILDEN